MNLSEYTSSVNLFIGYQMSNPTIIFNHVIITANKLDYTKKCPEFKGNVYIDSPEISGLKVNGNLYIATYPPEYWIMDDCRITGDVTCVLDSRFKKPEITFNNTTVAGLNKFNGSN
jgi:hypothetical protein